MNEDSKWNPCNWKLYWPSISWLETDCLCCSLTRAIVLGIGAGFIIASFSKWETAEAILGCVVVFGVALLSVITPKKPPTG